MRTTPKLAYPNITELFGGSTRTRTLAVLANASTPLTGYRVAVTAGTQPIKTNAVLERLKRLGIVTERTTAVGRRGWELTDRDFATFLRRRVRLSWIEDWQKEVMEKSALASRVAVQFEGFNLSGYSPNRALLADQKEFERPESKDRAVERAGLRASVRRSRR